MYDNVKLLIDEDGCQLVPIPDEYPFPSENVVVNGFGGHISIMPAENVEAAFQAAIEVLGPDFMIEEYPDERFAEPENGEETDHGN